MKEGRWLIFTTGKGPGTNLALLNSRNPDQPVTFVRLGIEDGSTASSPVVTRTAEGRLLAFVFQDHTADAELTDRLIILDLDPDRDDQFDDAAIIQTLTVGHREVERHNGHHAIDFDADSRFGFFTNPGDGPITVLSLKDLKPVTSFPVGGKPTALIAIGGQDQPD